MINILNNKQRFFGIVLGLLVFFVFTPLLVEASLESFLEHVKGKIYLQVQSVGEAWYVNPADGKRYYLGRPADAFSIMRTLGIGITNADLAKITVGDINQITASHGNAPTRMKGKIYLQVQSAGEAWYVNPADAKRYYLGRPADAFNIMRTLGIGITNADLDKIPIHNEGAEDGPELDTTDLDELIDEADSALGAVDSAIVDFDSLDESEDEIPLLVL